MCKLYKDFGFSAIYAALYAVDAKSGLQHSSDGGEEITRNGKDLEKGIPEHSAEPTVATQPPRCFARSTRAPAPDTSVLVQPDNLRLQKCFKIYTIHNIQYTKTKKDGDRKIPL